MVIDKCNLTVILTVHAEIATQPSPTTQETTEAATMVDGNLSLDAIDLSQDRLTRLLDIDIPIRQ